MTLGGMMKHLAVVESGWFEETFRGGEAMPPFDTVDWDADPDWEWRTAADDSPEELRALFDEACAARPVIERRSTDGAGSTRRRCASRREASPFSLRWILVHMIEEYARHNGHADLIRRVDRRRRRVSLTDPRIRAADRRRLAADLAVLLGDRRGR